MLAGAFQWSICYCPVSSPDTDIFWLLCLYPSHKEGIMEVLWGRKGLALWVLLSPGSLCTEQSLQYVNQQSRVPCIPWDGLFTSPQIVHLRLSCSCQDSLLCWHSRAPPTLSHQWFNCWINSFVCTVFVSMNCTHVEAMSLAFKTLCRSNMELVMN